MAKYGVFVEWNDMPLGFKSWLLGLRRLRGLSIKQWSSNDNGITEAMGFDIEEDDYQNNDIYMEMTKKFCNPKRKTSLKRWHIYDYAKKQSYLHVEEIE